VLEGIASRFTVSWGWRRALIALVAGGASALAMPPYDLFPILFLTFPVLVWLIDGTVATARTGRLGAVLAAAGVGWCFGFGYFLAGLWWIGRAFLVDADVFGWMMPFAVAALPAGLALFTAAGMALARLLWREGPRRIFAFALGLALADIARGHVLTGFPWNLFGYALAVTPAMMQAASLIGVYGLTVLAGFVFASPAALVGSGGRLARAGLPVAALAILAGLAGFGTWRLARADVAMVDGLRLRIVQPAIEQSRKWLPEHRNEIFADYLALSDLATSPDTMGIADIDILIWPESALPFLFEMEPAALPAIAALLPDRTTLVTGMQRIERDPSVPQGYRLYNSILVVDHAGTIVDAYDKVRLVPFGEFLPFAELLESIGLEPLTRVAGGFTAGAVARTMQAGPAPRFVPLVCYEAIFPGAVVPPGERPGWILNVTNDGWFGDTAGPWQHLRQARIRAVEEGLPLVRAANTGISAVIDPYGRMQRRLDLGVRGVIDSALPRPLPPTICSVWGNIFVISGLAAFALFAFMPFPRKQGFAIPVE